MCKDFIIKIYNCITKDNFRLLILFSIMAIMPLSTVYILQYFFGVEPCKLCIYQRIPLFIIAVSPLFFLLKKEKSIYGLIVVMLCIAANVALSFFHLGIENKWFENKLCTGAPKEGGFENLFMSLETMFHKCDEVKFRFLGLSLAGWNLIYCVFFLIFVQIFIIKHFFSRKN